MYRFLYWSDKLEIFFPVIPPPPSPPVRRLSVDYTCMKLWSSIYLMYNKGYFLRFPAKHVFWGLYPQTKVCHSVATCRSPLVCHVGTHRRTPHGPKSCYGILCHYLITVSSYLLRLKSRGSDLVKVFVLGRPS